MARWISVVKQTEEQNTHTHRHALHSVSTSTTFLPVSVEAIFSRFVIYATADDDGDTNTRYACNSRTFTLIDFTLKLSKDWFNNNRALAIDAGCDVIATQLIVNTFLHKRCRISHYAEAHSCSPSAISAIMHLVRCIPDHKLCMNFDDFTVFFLVSSLFLVVVSFFSFTHFDDRFDFCRLSVCWHFPWVVVAVVKLQQHLWYVRKPIEAKVSAWNYHGTPFMRHATYQNLSCQQFLWKLIYAAQIIPTYRFSQYRSRRHSSNERANG